MEEPQERVGRPKYTVNVTEIPKFDLSSYISNYKGRTIFRRLYLIASCSVALREEAARLAVAEAKRGNDIQHYYDAVAILKKITKGRGQESSLDMAWVDKKVKQNNAETLRLEYELKGYKNNLIKESIRMGSEDLGSHYHSMGDLPNATKAYSRMRDHCTTPSHIASTAFRLIAVSVEQGNWLAVQSQVHKIRNLQMKAEEAARTQPKSLAAMGLQQMAAGEYRDAALSFLNTESTLGESYNDVMTSNDVAVYGGLCALVSMSRSELQTKVLDNTNFRSFLELEPHIRRAISFFCSSKYSQCLEILDAYRADYLLDLYLQNHVDAIYEKIRTKSIVEYLRPFSRVTLDSMEGAFGRKVDMANGSANGIASASSSGAASSKAIEDELIAMIEVGTLDAKIDLESRVLVAREEDERAQLHKQSLKMVDGFIREARLKIMRMAAVNAGVEVKPPQNKKWGGGNTGGSVTLEDIVDVDGDNSFSTRDAAPRRGFPGDGYFKGKGKGKVVG